MRAPGARSRRGAEDRDVGVHGDSDGLLDARGPWFSRRVHVVRRPEQEHRGEGTGVGERGAVRVSERLERLEDGGGLRPEYLPRLSLVSRDACRVESVLGGEACQRLEARVLEEAGCGVVADERHVTVRHVAGRQTAETLGEDGSRQVRETHLGRRELLRRDPSRGQGLEDALGRVPSRVEGDVPSLRDRHESTRRVARVFSSDEATTTTPFPLFPRSGRLEDHNHVARDRAPDTAAAVRGVLSTPLQTVLSALQDLPPPKHRCAPSAGPGGARFVGGAGHKPQRVVTLNHNCTVADALEMLARHRILSAPVIIQPDPLRADDIHHERLESDDARVEPPTLLGFFDIGDALRCVVEELPEEDRVSHAPDHPRRNVLSWMRVMDGVERRVANKRLVSVLGDDAELMYRAGRRRPHPRRDPSRGFLDGRSANGAVHRIAIFDTNGEITRVVSMSDAVRYLASRADHLGGLAEMNLRRLGLVGRASEIEGGLVVVPPTTPAIEAFALMREKRVSGVGVLDDREGLIANLSASDLRCIQPEHFGILGLRG